uniref:Retrotrans_gag domain-containing protein n=1 Tax=Steinernema glaseri TaxID=37863 RepID=A0A1I7XX81_9BILA
MVFLLEEFAHAFEFFVHAFVHDTKTFEGSVTVGDPSPHLFRYQSRVAKKEHEKKSEKQKKPPPSPAKTPWPTKQPYSPSNPVAPTPTPPVVTPPTPTKSSSRKPTSTMSTGSSTQTTKNTIPPYLLTAIPAFKGKCDTTTFRAWLEKFCRTCKAFDVGDEEVRTKLFGLKLEDEAIAAFELLPKATKKDWRSQLDRMGAVYGQKGAEARQSYNALRMSPAFPKADGYSDETREQLKVDALTVGSSGDLMVHLLRESPKTWDDALSLARNEEKLAMTIAGTSTIAEVKASVDHVQATLEEGLRRLNLDRKDRNDDRREDRHDRWNNRARRDNYDHRDNHDRHDSQIATHSRGQLKVRHEGSPRSSNPQSDFQDVKGDVEGTYTQDLDDHQQVPEDDGDPLLRQGHPRVPRLRHSRAVDRIRHLGVVDDPEGPHRRLRGV